MMPLRQELFALSGMMLKIWIMSEIEMVSGRPVARRDEGGTARSEPRAHSDALRMRPARSRSNEVET